jgi:hypothetical protein
MVAEPSWLHSDRVQSTTQVGPGEIGEMRGAGRGPAAPRLTLGLLAASAGLGAANLYYAQPLAPMIARDFHASARACPLGPIMPRQGPGRAAPYGCDGRGQCSLVAPSSHPRQAS